jgi:toxin ParE1/3/4
MVRKRAESVLPSRLLRWSERALRDLENIGEYIARDNPKAAKDWVDRLFSRAADASVMPMAARMVRESARVDVREVLVSRYRIIFHVSDAAVTVLTVIEGHKLLGDLGLDEEE